MVYHWVYAGVWHAVPGVVGDARHRWGTGLAGAGERAGRGRPALKVRFGRVDHCGGGAGQGRGSDGAVPNRGARLTSRAFTDLALWMVGLGLLTGVVFPFAIVPLGVDPTDALRPGFFAATLTAGLLVGGANFVLARSVVGVRLRRLAHRMTYVADVIDQATYTGDWTRCSPEECELEIDSADEFGAAAASFNQLIHVLARSRGVEQALSGYARMLATHLEVEALAGAALDGALVHGGADAGTLCVLGDGELRVAAARRLDGEGLLASPLLRGALREPSLSVVEVPAELAIDAAVVTFRPATVALVPLWFKDVPVGLLVLAYGRSPQPAQLRLLESLQDPTGIALNNALAHESFQRLAAVDSLTGLYNCRFGLDRLREEYARAIRSGTPLGVLAIDVDHFKAVNDTYGHLVGDQVLRDVTAAARLALRDGDVFVRNGGEEFLVVLPGAEPGDVATIGERIRRHVVGTRLSVGEEMVQVTVSLGGLSFPHTPAESADDLLELVDRALYRSKALGRDRLTMCDQRDRERTLV